MIAKIFLAALVVFLVAIFIATLISTKAVEGVLVVMTAFLFIMICLVLPVAIVTGKA